MACSHRGFHRITSRYDRQAGVLTYVSFCEGCGATIGEVGRVSYRPRFLPMGNEPVSAAGGNPTISFTHDREPA
jgi:hypothetical protein